MTIAWFTPFSKKSAIGRCSGAIVTELSKYANVDIWHPETSDTHETKVKTVRFSHAERLDFTRLSAYDLIVYVLDRLIPVNTPQQTAIGVVLEHGRELPQEDREAPWGSVGLIISAAADDTAFLQPIDQLVVWNLQVDRAMHPSTSLREPIIQRSGLRERPWKTVEDGAAPGIRLR